VAEKTAAELIAEVERRHHGRNRYGVSPCGFCDVVHPCAEWRLARALKAVLALHELSAARWCSECSKATPAISTTSASGPCLTVRAIEEALR
jgi:hypothetical protein